MGKVLKVLSKSQVPNESIFGRRFVVECCEKFHIHHRNIRIELSPQDFQRVRNALKETEKTYVYFGEPSSCEHLELGRAELDRCKASELIIELCENLYKKLPTGWDSFFHDEDTFIHLHWRDLRIELSNSEFLLFAETVRRAEEELRALQLKDLSTIFDILEGFNIIYVVMRGWENFSAHGISGSISDIDVLIHPQHEFIFDRILGTKRTTLLHYRVQRQVEVAGKDGNRHSLFLDVRKPGDFYYPHEIAWRLLNRRMRYKNFWIPHPEDYLITLAYHIVHHKGYVDGKYHPILERLALCLNIQMPRLKCRHRFFPWLVNVLNSHKVKPVRPLDRSVHPPMKMLHPPETVLSSSFLCIYKGIPVFSRVYKINDINGNPVIVKQSTSVIAKQEYSILKNLDYQFFPKVWGFMSAGDSSSYFFQEYIEGPVLDEAHELILEWSFEDAQKFVSDLIKIIEILHKEGIEHRDIHGENIIVSPNGAVLIDFSWASSSKHFMDPPSTPDFGKEGRPPDGEPYDPYAIGVLIHKHIVPVFPEFESIAKLLLDGRRKQPVDWEKLWTIFNQVKKSGHDIVQERLIRVSADEFLEVKNRNFGGTSKEDITSTLNAASGIRADIYMADHGEDLSMRILRLRSLLIRLVHSCSSDQQNGSLLEALLEANVPRRGVLDDFLFDEIVEHFDQLVGLVRWEILGKFLQAQGKGKEFLVLLARFLCEQGTQEERNEFIDFLDNNQTYLSKECYPYLAQICYDQGEMKKAEYYAKLALDDNPYWSMCAHILAETHEAKKNYQAASQWWEYFAHLEGSNFAITDHYVMLKHLALQEAVQGDDGVQINEECKDPKRIFEQVKRCIESGEKEKALEYTKRLYKLLAHIPEGRILVENLFQLISMVQVEVSDQKIEIPPLTSNTYSEKPKVVLQQIQQLLPSQLGKHPIIRKKYKELSRLNTGSA